MDAHPPDAYRVSPYRNAALSFICAAALAVSPLARAQTLSHGSRHPSHPAVYARKEKNESDSLCRKQLVRVDSLHKEYSLQMAALLASGGSEPESKIPFEIVRDDSFCERFIFYDPLSDVSCDLQIKQEDKRSVKAIIFHGNALISARSRLKPLDEILRIYDTDAPGLDFAAFASRDYAIRDDMRYSSANPPSSASRKTYDAVYLQALSTLEDMLMLRIDEIKSAFEEHRKDMLIPKKRKKEFNPFPWTRISIIKT